jgi:hypothetical protein
MKSPMKNSNFSSDFAGASGSPMDLVADIEQETATACGEPSGMDKALLLMAQGHSSSDIGENK